MTNNNAIQNELRKIEDTATWQLTGPIIKSREGEIYRAFSIKSGLTLAVKQYYPHMNQAAPQQQFDAFQRYQNSMATINANLKVPKVFSYDRENKLLLMEWVTGKSLHHYFWIPSIENKRRDLLKKAGEWLRSFHEASDINICEVNFVRELRSIEERITNYSATSLNSNPSRQYFHKIHDIFKQTISNLPPINAPHAMAHGDFTPFNMLLDNEKMVGLDVWASARKSIYVDLARMIVYLTIAYPLVSRQPVYDDTGKIQEKLIPLLEGYGTDIINPASSLFKSSLLSEYLRRGLVIGKRPHSIKGAITDRYQLSQIRKQIQAVLNTLHHT